MCIRDSFSFTFDWFYDKRYNQLVKRNDIPQILGVGTSPINVARTSNMAVSYTHLDVYKRQGHCISSLCRRTLSNIVLIDLALVRDSIRNQFEASSLLNCRNKAVSYTHLKLFSPVHPVFAVNLGNHLFAVD